MGMADVKALTFDTGGTILDWHSGFRDALAAATALRAGDAADPWSGLTTHQIDRVAPLNFD